MRDFRKRAMLAAAAGVLTYGATGLPVRQVVRLPLTLAAAFVAGGLTMQAKVASKSYAVENRLDAHVAATAPAVSLQANGGSINGSLQVNGNNHISGTLYGSGGVLPVGDTIDGTIDLGNGGLQSLFTGSVAPGSSSVSTLPTSNWFNPASNTTVSQVVTNINGGLVTQLNAMVNSLNQTATAVAYIQNELQAHKFSST